MASNSLTNGISSEKPVGGRPLLKTNSLQSALGPEDKKENAVVVKVLKKSTPVTESASAAKKDHNSDVVVASVETVTSWENKGTTQVTRKKLVKNNRSSSCDSQSNSQGRLSS